MSQKKYDFLFLLFLVVVLIPGCTNEISPSESSTETQGYPSATITMYSPAYPIATANTVSQTAFETFPFALEVARKWDPDSVLYAIPATGLMEMNLGYPPTGLGWFFIFKGKDPQLEYYVMVNDGQIIGTTEAQPIVVGERAKKYLPLPSLDKMIDSDEVVNLYLANSGEQYKSEHPDAIINPHLEYESSSHDFPTWIIFDISQGRNMAPLMYINALTGKVVE